MAIESKKGSYPLNGLRYRRQRSAIFGEPCRGASVPRESAPDFTERSWEVHSRKRP